MPLTLAQVIIIVISFGVVGAISTFIYIFVLYVSLIFFIQLIRKILLDTHHHKRLMALSCLQTNVSPWNFRYVRYMATNVLC
jgi:hypothetical protein